MFSEQRLFGILLGLLSLAERGGPAPALPARPPARSLLLTAPNGAACDLPALCTNYQQPGVSACVCILPTMRLKERTRSTSNSYEASLQAHCKVPNFRDNFALEGANAQSSVQVRASDTCHVLVLDPELRLCSVASFRNAE